MLDLEQDRLVFWAIMLLVIVADPLAVTLTVACNMALIRFLHRRQSRPKITPTSPLFGGAPQRLIDSLVEGARVMALTTTHGTFAPAAPRCGRAVNRSSRVGAEPGPAAKNAAGAATNEP